MNLNKLLIFSLLLISLSATAQFSLKNGKLLSSGDHINTRGIDTIFVLENLNNATLLYTHPDSTGFSWSRFSIENGTITEPTLIPSSIVANSLTSELSITEEGGYELEIGDLGSTEKKYIWVIDYERYEPTVDTLIVYDSKSKGADSCNHIIIEAFSTSDTILVGDFVNHRITRLTRFQSVEWTAKPALNFSENEFTMHLFEPNIPYEDTEFKAELQESLFSGVEPFTTGASFETDYEPVAVKIDNIQATVIERDNNNELEKVVTGEVKGSAPLNVNFSTKGTNSKVAYYDWEILALAELDSQRISFALDSFRYEFIRDINTTDIPDYTARVTVSNDFCHAGASEDIKIVSSYLDATNILILGFGTDEAAQQFKVVYKSIRPETFQGAIYNRWGRRVFSWTNPELGWDGRFNGRYVSPGVYYYVVMATGTDGEKWKIKRDLNVIREKGLK